MARPRVILIILGRAVSSILQAGLPSRALCRFFHWQHSGVLIPFFFAGSGTIIGIALAVPAGASAALFHLADLFMFLGGLWSAGYWWTSDFLNKKMPATGEQRNPRKANSAKRSMTRFNRWRWGVLSAIGLTVWLCLAGIGKLALDKELESLSGRMFPGSDPTPPNPCPERLSEDVLVIFGDNASAVDHFPHTILEVRDQPVLALDRDQSGMLVLLLEVRSQDNRIIVRLDRDGFTVNPNNYLKMIRPDRNSLIVIDQEGREVINAKYVNPRTFQIDGAVTVPSKGLVPLRLPDTSRACLAHTAGADISLR